MAMAAAIAAVTLTGCGNKDSETVTEKTILPAVKPHRLVMEESS